MKRFAMVAAVALAGLFAGCHSMFAGRDYGEINYTGDGRLIDAGRKAGIHRFSVDLGSVDLNARAEITYSLGGLPEAQMVCYLRVDEPLGITGGPKSKIDWGDTVFAMRVVDDAGEEVFAERSALSKWIWSGNVGAQRSDLYTRKTVFTPSEGRSYELHVKVDPAAGKAPAAQLLIMGGGWKVERAGM